MALTATYDLNSLFATTFQHAKKEIVDNIIRDSIFLALMGQKDLAPSLRKSRTTGDSKVFGDGIELMDDPGRQIQFPLMYKKNTTVQSYANFDILNITPQDPFTVALYDWRSFAGSVNLSYEDLDKNSGTKTKIIDYMNAYIKNLELSIQNDMTDMLLGSRAAGTAQTFGLLDLIKDDPTTNPSGGNIGGISAVDNTWWRNYAYDFASAAFGTDQSGAGCYQLRQMIYGTTFGTKRPTVLLGGNNAFESLMQALVAQNRFMNKGAQELANAGFDAITFQNIPVCREPKIETVRAANALSGDAFYALQLDYMKIFGMKKRWFEPTPMKTPVDQDTTVMSVITRLALATNARRQLGVMYGIVAPS